LRSGVDLLPQSQVIIRATNVGRERDARYVVEHNVREAEICQVDDGPACLLVDAWKCVDKDLAADDEQDVDEPGSFAINPFRVPDGHWVDFLIDVLPNLLDFDDAR